MKMKFSRILYFFTLIQVSFLPYVYLSKSGSSGLFLNRYPIPKKTPDPININTEKAHYLNFKPFILHGTTFDKVTLINNGKLVELLVDQPTNCSITGGILGFEVYQLFKIIYFWTDNEHGAAATKIDGEGYPLEDRGMFFNKKYKSFKNALKHRDGLVVLCFPVSICPVKPNVFYFGYAESLKQVQQAGSTAVTTLGNAILWLAAFIPVPSNYYAYAGSYFDEKTGERYYCATVIVIPSYPQMCISKNQFAETFGSFENAKGNPLTNVARRFRRNMPVVEVTGIINFNTPS